MELILQLRLNYPEFGFYFRPGIHKYKVAKYCRNFNTATALVLSTVSGLPHAGFLHTSVHLKSHSSGIRKLSTDVLLPRLRQSDVSGMQDFVIVSSIACYCE